MELESIVRAFLHNAAARHWAVDRATPERPSVEYRTGFAAGKEAGELAALALVLAEITGESVTTIMEEARAQAAVETSMPFDLRIELLDGGAEGEPGARTWSPSAPAPAPSGDDEPDSSPSEADFVPCPRCWLPAEVLAPAAFDTNPRSRCPRGHEITLVPAVLAHLRSLLEERDESAS